MRRKLGFSLLVLTLLLGLFGGTQFNAVHARSSAEGSCTQVGGTFLINFVDQTTAIAALTGDLQGAVRGVIVKSAAGDKGVLNLSLEHAITTSSGDSIRTADQAVLTPVQDKTYFMSQTQTIMSGTGRFANATGTIKEFGAVDMATGQGVLRYSGQICTKAS
ncbi:MAG: hypothetical protein ABI947_07950 [Chloroflexota bacterium]